MSLPQPRLPMKLTLPNGDKVDGVPVAAVLSGGLDSATALAMALAGLVHHEGYPIFPVEAVSIYYGQRHAKELNAAAEIAAHYGLKWTMLNISFPQAVKDASLLMQPEANLNIPKEEYERASPPTYVPHRNIAILTAIAQHVYGREIYGALGGWHAADIAYPDCRAEFLFRAQQALTCSGDLPFYVCAPLVALTKLTIVRDGYNMKVPFEKTWSCYGGGEKACGVCGTCRQRLAAFEDLGLEDPIEYETRGDDE